MGRCKEKPAGSQNDFNQTEKHYEKTTDYRADRTGIAKHGAGQSKAKTTNTAATCSGQLHANKRHLARALPDCAAHQNPNNAKAKQAGESEMIEQTARDYVKQAYRDGKKPSFYAAEKSLKRGMIWQVMEECRYNQSDAAAAMGIDRTTLRSWIGQVFTNDEMANMGIES